MLTLAQLRQLHLDLLQTEGNMRGTDPVIADVNAQINWAYRVIARKLYLTGSAPLTLTAGQNIYDLRNAAQVGGKVVKPFYTYINNVPLRDASQGKFGFWSMDELVRLQPYWKTAGEALPYAAALYSYNELLLFPTPDASTVALGNHSVFGQILPPDLANDGDIPLIPEEVMEACAFLSSRLALTPMIQGSEAKGWKLLQEYDTYWTQVIEDVARQNSDTMQSWGSTDAYASSDLMII